MGMHPLNAGVYTVEFGEQISESTAHLRPATTSQAPDPLKRPNFFAGRMIDAAALAAEQDYQREKRRRHNRAVLGDGVVAGLNVGIDSDAGAATTVISSGYAIDAFGEEISLPCDVAIKLPLHTAVCFVTVAYTEIPCKPVPLPGGGQAFANTEEACVVALTDLPKVPVVVLAKLRRDGDRWSVDLDFVPRRVPRAMR